MELTEAVQRILRHGRLILVIVVIFLSIPILLGSDSDASYVASARANFGPDPTTRTSRRPWSTRRRPSSPPRPRSRMRSTGRAIDRDPTSVVDEIDVESVGVSGVLVVSATDADPEVASALANGLAQQFLVSARHDLLIGPMEERLADLNQQLEDIDAEITGITDERRRGRRSHARRRLDAALSAQSDIQNQRDTLSQTIDATPQPALLDPGDDADRPGAIRARGRPGGRRPARADPGRGPGGGHRGAPPLDRERRRPRPRPRRSSPRAHPEPVRTAPPTSPTPVTTSCPFTRAGRHQRPPRRGPPHGCRRPMSISTAWPPAAARSTQRGRRLVGPDRPDTPRGPRASLRGDGLVVVAPEVLPRTRSVALEHLLAVTQWPLVGIIAYPGPLWTHYHFRQTSDRSDPPPGGRGRERRRAPARPSPLSRSAS